MAARKSKAKTTSTSVSTKRKVEADISNKKAKATPINDKRLSKTFPSFLKKKWAVLAIILGAIAGLLYLFKGFFTLLFSLILPMTMNGREWLQGG